MKIPRDCCSSPSHKLGELIGKEEEKFTTRVSMLRNRIKGLPLSLFQVGDVVPIYKLFENYERPTPQEIEQLEKRAKDIERQIHGR